ncbi:MAG TPA: hypothetical protein ENI13_01565, partial [candidate division CPR3 bacterium]|nr:hypothetical protein [candidate division CPR3 bacterium]
MKTIFILITLIFLFSLTTGVLAQETELPDPGLLPDSPFYFLEIIAEGIGTFFTFGDLKKAERFAALAEERLSEANAMAEKGKVKLVEKTLERYEDQLEKALFRAEKADTEGKDTKELAKVITEATYKHLIVLNKVLEKVPEEAKPAIERAMTVSVKGHEKAVEVLKAKGALSEVSKGDSLPEEIPEALRERIQSKAQEQLQKEKVERAKQEALESFESFESLRDFCLETGGPPDMCNKIPLGGFESFEALKAYCVESGGPSQICSSLEADCREMGITTPDECFVAISTSTRETYNAAEPTSVPISSSTQVTVSNQRSESSALLRAKCIERGGVGPSEVCDKIPLQGFGGSWEVWETYCLGLGGPPEICLSSETACKVMYGLI